MSCLRVELWLMALFACNSNFLTQAYKAGLASHPITSVFSRETMFFHQTVIEAKNRQLTLKISMAYICSTRPRYKVRFTYKLLIYNVKNRFSTTSVISFETIVVVHSIRIDHCMQDYRLHVIV
jgi:hypothetical protein